MPNKDVKIGDLVEMNGYYFVVTCVEGTKISMRELGTIEEAEMSEVRKAEYSELAQTGDEDADADDVAEAL